MQYTYTLHDGTICARVVVPHRLRGVLGRNELRRSLKIHSTREAARRLPAVLSTMFDVMDRAEATQLEREAIQDQLEDAWKTLAAGKATFFSSEPDAGPADFAHAAAEEVADHSYTMAQMWARADYLAHPPGYAANW